MARRELTAPPRRRGGAATNSFRLHLFMMYDSCTNTKRPYQRLLQSPAATKTPEPQPRLHLQDCLRFRRRAVTSPPGLFYTPP